jgi:hypothetical protein
MHTHARTRAHTNTRMCMLPCSRHLRTAAHAYPTALHAPRTMLVLSRMRVTLFEDSARSSCASESTTSVCPPSGSATLNGQSSARTLAAVSIRSNNASNGGARHRSIPLPVRGWRLTRACVPRFESVRSHNGDGCPRPIAKHSFLSSSICAFPHLSTRRRRLAS